MSPPPPRSTMSVDAAGLRRPYSGSHCPLGFVAAGAISCPEDEVSRHSSRSSGTYVLLASPTMFSEPRRGSWSCWLFSALCPVPSAGINCHPVQTEASPSKRSCGCLSGPQSPGLQESSCNGKELRVVRR